MSLGVSANNDHSLLAASDFLSSVCRFLSFRLPYPIIRLVRRQCEAFTGAH